MYICIDAYTTCCIRYYIWYTEQVWLVHVVKDIRVFVCLRVCPSAAMVGGCCLVIK